jgi:hypothetical protein
VRRLSLDPHREEFGVRVRLIMTVCLAMVSISVCAQNNYELIQLFQADQEARRSNAVETDWKRVNAEDAERRQTVLAILEDGDVRTALDYYNAAMIFQHGESADEIRLANSFASISAALDDSSEAARWLKAATWDRLMLKLGRPQWYGTQFVRDDQGKWVLYTVDTDAVTDEQRAALAVPSLVESESRVAIMNGER